MLPALILTSLALQAAPPPAVWVEGESPATASPEFKKGGWGRDILSGKSWLFAAIDGAERDKLKPEGLGASYRFEARAAGKYAVHLRVGYEFARSPFKWRIDAGDWQAVSPDEYTTDLMAIADFAEVAWLPARSVELMAGAHTLEIAVPKPPKERLLFGFDCACIVPDVPGAFRPEGRTKPGGRRLHPLIRNEVEGRPSGPGDFVAPLTGTWGVARFDEPGEIAGRTEPLAALPEPIYDREWRTCTVPAPRDIQVPEWDYCHRLLYEYKLVVPDEFAGRSLVLRFPNNAVFSTVFVNDTRVGFSDLACVAFECDITRAVKLGTVNTITVCVKDHYYAVATDGDGKSPRRLFNVPPSKFLEAGGLSFTRFADYPVMYKSRRTGILEAPELVVGGIVRPSDVFVRPSVANKLLTVECELVNSSAALQTAEVRHSVSDGGKVVWQSPPAVRSLKPGERTAAVELAAPFADAKLWWPDAPAMYTLDTEVRIDGKLIGVTRTPFGFRDWGTRGDQFTLNGVPWKFRADLRGSGYQASEKDALATVEEWRRNGQTTMRYWGEEPWLGKSQKESLDFFDKHGVAVRRSGLFDGEVATYALVQDGKVNKPLFDNWRRHLAAWVRAERNHPSIHIWSLENEVTFINARNFGWLKEVEPEIKAAVAMVQHLDPTRPVMIDGGNALTDASLPVVGNHYLEVEKRHYPEEAYTLKQAMAVAGKPGTETPWPLPLDRPLFLGESYFATGAPPAEYAEIIGDRAFLGRAEASAGVTKFARMLSEGYRWRGVAAFHFWFAEGPGADHYKAWQPVAALVRERDTLVAGGQKLTRTVKVFNDTRFDTPITLTAEMQVGGATFHESQLLTIPPGTSSGEIPLSFDLPARKPGEVVGTKLKLSLARDGKAVFEESVPLRAYTPLGKVRVGSGPGDLVVYDPSGKLAPYFGAPPVKAFADIRSAKRLLIIGPDALTAAEANDPIWTSLALKGVRVIVLDQQHPIQYQATPADLEATAHDGYLAFPEDSAQPLLKSVAPSDLTGWPKLLPAYRHAYRKPARGARSIVQCGRELGESALVEVPIGPGLLILSQLNLGGAPDSAIARLLLDNMLERAAGYKLSDSPAAAVLPPGDRRAALLTEIGATAAPAQSVAEALRTRKLIVLDGTAKQLGEVNSASAEFAEFTKRGGQLLVWGVTPDSVSAFSKLVGVDHAIRPFRLERVTLRSPRDPLAAGLSLRDVALESAEKIYPWAGDRYPASDTFTHVVDLDDPAPFLTNASPADGWKQMTNGLTSADSWKFIFYHDQSTGGERPKWSADLARPETVRGLSIVLNADYRVLTKLRVTFDGDPKSAIDLELKPQRELRQEFDFPPRAAKSITLEPLSWTAHEKPVIGVDNLWLKVEKPPEWATKVRPLTNVGGLVRYPMGPGGVVLCQLNIPATEANPENAAKKRAVVATLLRNMGAAFAQERVVVPGENLATTPIELGPLCNAFLDAERFPGGAPGLPTLPLGEQTFAGVRYAVRDFRTSPLPAALLVEPGAKLLTLSVGRRADALFFLATAVKTPDRLDDKTDHALATIRVKYADGQAADIPVKLGEQVGPWRTPEAKPLPQGRVGYSVTAGGAVSTLYQVQWTNPRPSVSIESAEFRAAGNAPGRLVVVGVSVGVGR